MDQNEAISAVVDEGFLGEDDEDYEDLYNDVNVGEGFLRKNEDLGFKKEDENKLGSQPLDHVDNNDLESSKHNLNIGLGGNQEDVSGRGSAGLLGQSSAKVEIGPMNNNNNGMQNIGMVQQQPHHVGAANTGGDGLPTHGSGNVNGTGGNVYGNGGAGMSMAGGGGGTVLFVGDLHWWTTDAELESELCKYGHVKEVKFFDEKASGKSKGYCQVEFYDPSAAIACKEGMNGHVFNGRPCVVAYASPFSVKRMGEAQVNRNQQLAQGSAAQAKRGPGDLPAKPGGNNMPAGGSFQGGGDNRGFGRECDG